MTLTVASVPGCQILGVADDVDLAYGELVAAVPTVAPPRDADPASI